MSSSPSDFGSSKTSIGYPCFDDYDCPDTTFYIWFPYVRARVWAGCFGGGAGWQLDDRGQLHIWLYIGYYERYCTQEEAQDRADEIAEVFLAIPEYCFPFGRPAGATENLPIVYRCRGGRCVLEDTGNDPSIVAFYLGCQDPP